MKKATMDAFRFDDTHISIKCYGKTEELFDNFTELIEEKFVPVNFGGHLMKFSCENIRKMEKYQKLVHYSPRFEIINWEDVMPEMVEESRRIPFERLYQHDRLDKKYSQALVKDGTLMAVMAVIRLSGNCLSIVHLAMREEMNFELTWIEMLSVFFQKAEKEFADDGEFLIQTGLDKGYNGIISICGQPDNDLFFHEYGITTVDSEEADELMEKLHREITYEECDIIQEYFNCEEAYWPTVQAIDRIPYAADLRKLPQNLLYEYFREYQIWFNRWNMENSRERIKTILFECGHTADDPNVACIYGCRSHVGKEMFYAYRTKGTLPETEHRNITIADVHFFRMSERTDEFYDVLPEQFRNIYDVQKFVIICATIGENELIGYAMLNRLPLSEDTSNLEFVYVLSGYQGIGIGEKLVQYAMAESECRGYHQMLVKDIGKKESGHKIETYIERICRVKNRVNGNIIEYSMKDFKNSTFYKEVIPKRKSLPKTVFIEDMDDIRIRRFSAWSREDGYCFEKRHLDSFFCSFCEDEEEQEITAMMEVSQVSTRGIYIRDIYIDSDYSTDLVAPSLLAATLEHVDQEMPQDTMVIFQVFDEKFYHAFEHLFGESNQDFYITDLLVETAGNENMELPEENDQLDIRQMFAEKLSHSSLIEKIGVQEKMLVAMSLNPYSRIPGHEMSKYIYQSKYSDYVKGDPKMHYEIVDDEKRLIEQFGEEYNEVTARNGSSSDIYILEARKKGINVVSLLICDNRKSEEVRGEDVYVDDRFQGLGYEERVMELVEESVGTDRLLMNQKLLHG